MLRDGIWQVVGWAVVICVSLLLGLEWKRGLGLASSVLVQPPSVLVQGVRRR
jgi:hypothetical protein